MRCVPFCLGAATLALFGCQQGADNPDPPPTPGPPQWIASPENIPSEFIGKNNCHFSFPAGAIWNFHRDGSCWETLGPPGQFIVLSNGKPGRWWRNQQQDIHVPNLRAVMVSEPVTCEGSPADVSPIKVCAAELRDPNFPDDPIPGAPAQGVAAPFNCKQATTGRGGCVNCDPVYKCHTHVPVREPDDTKKINR
jgi:hypothetical protein